MCHRHSGLSTYGLKGLRKGDEHPAYAQHWVRHLYLYLYLYTRLTAVVGHIMESINFLNCTMLLSYHQR